MSRSRRRRRLTGARGTSTMPRKSHSHPSPPPAPTGPASPPATPPPTPTELAALRYERTVATNAWIPHQPHDKQQLFLMHDEVRECLYGGAAGGGKTDALLQAALQYAHVPGYA